MAPISNSGFLLVKPIRIPAIQDPVTLKQLRAPRKSGFQDQLQIYVLESDSPSLTHRKIHMQQGQKAWPSHSEWELFAFLGLWAVSGTRWLGDRRWRMGSPSPVLPHGFHLESWRYIGWLLASSQENEKIPSEITGKLKHHQQGECWALEGQMSLGSSYLSWRYHFLWARNTKCFQVMLFGYVLIEEENCPNL